MSEMVERVARALCKLDCERDPRIADVAVQRCVDECWRDWKPAARVAIEAMREPTRPMLNRGGYHCIAGAGAVSNGDMAQAKAIWKAMINEAIPTEP